MSVFGQTIEQPVVKPMGTKRKEEEMRKLCFSVSKGYGYKDSFPFGEEKVYTELKKQ